MLRSRCLHAAAGSAALSHAGTRSQLALNHGRSLFTLVHKRTLPRDANAVLLASAVRNRMFHRVVSEHTRAEVHSLIQQPARQFWVLASDALAWCKAPKGFGKFFPKSGGSAQGKTVSKGPVSKAGGGSKGSGSKGSGDGGDGGGGSSGNPSWMLQTGAAFSALILVNMLLPSNSDGPAAKEISWQTFKTEYLEPGRVEKVVVANKSIAKVYVKQGYTNPDDVTTIEPEPGQRQEPGKFEVFFNIGSVDNFDRKLDDIQKELDIDPRQHVPVVYAQEISMVNELMKLAPTLLLIGFFLAMSRGAISQMGGMGGGGAGGMFNVGKAKPTIISKTGKVSVTFKDVAGCDEAKVEIMEFVDFLKNPKKYERLGAEVPRGALLFGPPGTGKTMLAKATAGEANVPFLSMNGSDFIEMFVGVGPSRVRDLFAQARKSAPCILFIDEIDAIGRARGRSGMGGGGSDERENTLNAMLVEMDGFNTKSGVVILGGTNRPDILDKALLRPGRFDRQVEIGIPDKPGREAILKVHLKPLKMAGDRDKTAEVLSAMTPGMSGAQLANVCNEAALIAARHERPEIIQIDFESAIDRTIAGIERTTKVLDPKEREMVAYHEAGHAVAGWYLEHVDPLLKVSIVPRGGSALGYAQYVPKEQFLKTKEELEDTLCMALGGRIAEQEFFNAFSSGAQNDLERVTDIAFRQVALFGMNERLGLVSYPGEDGFLKPYGEATAQMIDEEVKKIVDTAHARTEALLTEHREKVEIVAQLLLKQEKITAQDVQAAIGDRPFDDGYEAGFVVGNTDADVEKQSSSEIDGTADGEDGDSLGGVSPTMLTARVHE